MVYHYTFLPIVVIFRFARNQHLIQNMLAHGVLLAPLTRNRSSPLPEYAEMGHPKQLSSNEYSIRRCEEKR